MKRHIQMHAPTVYRLLNNRVPDYAPRHTCPKYINQVLEEVGSEYRVQGTDPVADSLKRAEREVNKCLREEFMGKALIKEVAPEFHRLIREDLKTRGVSQGQLMNVINDKLRELALPPLKGSDNLRIALATIEKAVRQKQKNGEI